MIAPDITWILGGAVSLLGAAFFLTSKLRKRRVGEPEVVKGSMIWGSAADFSKNAVEFLQKTKRQYGDIFTMRLINQYITIIMDPNLDEALNSERNFDFDPIQKQVNWNVFSFVLREPKKMIKDTGRTVRGRFMQEAMDNFVNNLNQACDKLMLPGGEAQAEWSRCGLRQFSANTVFDAVFNTVFGRGDGHPFNASMVYENFEVYHRYFNYMWLGMPRSCFPKAGQALKELLVMPDSQQLLDRKDLSAYMRTAIEYMREHEQTEADIKGHNLVYLHVNFNTFRMAFWVLHNLLEHPEAMAALQEEVDGVIDSRLDTEHNTAELTLETVENMKILDSVVQETSRLSSGVFMIRYVKEDTMFTMGDGKQYLIRKGDRVAVYPPAIHKSAEIFQDPLKFKYDRFIDTEFQYNGRTIKHPVLTFGTLCPGKRYALVQIKWFILTVLSRFHIRRVEGEHAEYDYNYYGHEILPPVKDVSFEYRARNSHPILSFLQR